MNAPWTERNGGIWKNRSSTENELVMEAYNFAREAFSLIWRRASDGYYEVEYLRKENAGPQWSLPFWKNVADSGIFETEDDARLYINAISESIET